MTILVFAGTIAGSGCAGESRQVAAEGQGTSAGNVELVEELQIDGVQNDLVPIGPIAGVAVRSDGVLALRQRQDHRIAFFGPAGEPLGSFGGPGAGPGEFQAIGRMGWLADTLWVMDPEQRRMTLIAPDLTLARTMIVPMIARPAPADSGRIPAFPFAIPLHPNQDGTFLAFMGTAIGDAVPEPFREASVYGLIGGDGEVVEIHVISRVAEGSSVRSASGGVASVPFVSRSRYVVAPDGSRSAYAESVVEGERAGSIRLVALDPGGDTLFARVYSFDAVPIPQNVRDSVLTAHERRLRTMSPELADAFREKANPPADYPAIEDLLVGNDGSIWIERPSPGTARAYFAIAADGQPLGELELPRSSWIAAAERTRIWVLERNADDVESVVRYRVTWQRSAS